MFYKIGLNPSATDHFIIASHVFFTFCTCFCEGFERVDDAEDLLRRAQVFLGRDFLDEAASISFTGPP